MFRVTGPHSTPLLHSGRRAEDCDINIAGLSLAAKTVTFQKERAAQLSVKSVIPKRESFGGGRGGICLFHSGSKARRGA